MSILCVYYFLRVISAKKQIEPKDLIVDLIIYVDGKIHNIHHIMPRGTH